MGMSYLYTYLASHEYTRFYEAASVEFCYLQVHHLAQVHPLLHHFVIPNIDVSEYVNSPELAIVVLYKRLVIGFGMISKEGYIPVLFLHPEWLHESLLSTLVSLLIQACPASLISTHVNICRPYLMDMVPMLQHIGMIADSYHINYYDKFYKVKDQHALYMTCKK